MRSPIAISMLKRRLPFDSIIAIDPKRNSWHPDNYNIQDLAEELQEVEGRMGPPLKLYKGRFLNPYLDDGKNGRLYAAYHHLMISFVPYEETLEDIENPVVDSIVRNLNYHGRRTQIRVPPAVNWEQIGRINRTLDEADDTYPYPDDEEDF